MHGGCEHFEWIDDSFYDKVRSMVVAIMVKNESLAGEIEALQNIKNEREIEKQEVNRLKERRMLN